MKQLKKIQMPFRQAIYDSVSELTSFPNVQNVKALVKHKYQYRLRVGNYRVLFDYTDSVKIISIEEVKKRDDNTY